MINPVMRNKEIASLVAREVFAPCQDEVDFALQLLVEKLCIPPSTVKYSLEQIEDLILIALNNADAGKEK